MGRISGLVGRKIIVAVALVVMMVGAGAYALAVDGKSSATPATKNVMTMQGPPTIQYRAYDMFMEPWGEWWPARMAYYSEALLITSEPGANTVVFMPATYQGIIYAPYRFSIDATDWPGGPSRALNVHEPEFMPVLGTTQTGLQATADIDFQYIYQDWWDSYWIPTWGGDANWLGDAFYPGGTDGYYLGVTYNVTLNRAAAEEWLGMPQAAVPATWWAANKAAYVTAWNNWILAEGNDRLDIFCGYAWTYDILTSGAKKGTYMSMSVDVSGNVVLNIAHLSWGYEVLMTRWLAETKLSAHEPWYEDFTMDVAYADTSANVLMDAVAQFSLHAVKATGTTDSAAWVWEPNKIDYITKVGHPSEYKPYSSRTYLSQNSGDTFFGTQVSYEQTPYWFNLTAGQSLTIELPTGTSPAYKGVGLTEGDYDDLYAGDAKGFWNIMDNGTLGLGSWITGWPLDTGLDLTPLYNPVTRTLAIAGPVSFNNEWYTPTGVLVHGAPWIEFWVDHTGPVADAGADMNNVVGGTPVSFDGTASSDDVRIFNYTWTFTHNSVDETLYGPTPDFTFLQTGDYTVTLEVMDSVGNVDTDTMIVHVTTIIPEFPIVLIPIVATLAVVVVLRKRRH